MNRSLKEITQDALRLLPSEQMKLASILLSNVEKSDPRSVSESEAEAAWEEEIGRRIKEIDAGKAKGRPFAEVMAEYNQRFRKGRSSGEPSDEA